VSIWHDDVVGVILGDGPGKRLIEEISDNLGIRDRILTPGNVSREHYFEVLSFGSIFFVESLDHITYSIMYPSKISDYIYIGKPFIWSLNPESKSWHDYPLLVKPAKYIDSFFDHNEEYVSEVASLIHRFINDNSFKTQCFVKFNEIKNGFKSWTEIANDVLATYEKLKPMNDIPDSQKR
jgi:glycosyltransferase involved in cell wall biosynthesis